MGFKLTTLEVIDTDYTGSCKSNYHTITTTTAPDRNLWFVNIVKTFLTLLHIYGPATGLLLYVRISDLVLLVSFFLLEDCLFLLAQMYLQDGHVDVCMSFYLLDYSVFSTQYI